MSVSLNWNCAFTIVSLVLASTYLVVLVFTIFLLLRLCRLPRASRLSQKLYVSLILLTTLLRSLYFLYWPTTVTSSSDECVISADDRREPVAVSIAGSLPAALFVSAFSVNTFTFARVYYRRLSSSAAAFSLLIAFLLAVNAAVYAVVALLVYAFIYGGRDVAAHVDVVLAWSVSVSALLVALAFSYYGLRLYRGVGGKLHQTQQENIQQTVAAAAAAASVSAASASASASASALRNPIRNVLIVSSLCLVCFSVRAVVLPIVLTLNGGDFSIVTLTPYLLISEVCPIVIVFAIFDTTSNKQQTRSETHVSASLLSDDWAEERLSPSVSFTSPPSSLHSSYQIPSVLERAPSAHSLPATPVSPAHFHSLDHHSRRQTLSESFKADLIHAVRGDID